VSVKPLPRGLLPAVGTSPSLGPAQLAVLSAWFTKYCPDTEAQQAAAVAQACAPDVRFEDNFVMVRVDAGRPAAAPAWCDAQGPGLGRKQGPLLACMHVNMPPPARAPAPPRGAAMALGHTPGHR
jgi:hypothetical protein